jgi:hypothetical protein
MTVRKESDLIGLKPNPNWLPLGSVLMQQDNLQLISAQG